MIALIKQSVSNFFCSHKKSVSQLGYGYLSSYGLGSYSYDECGKCHKFLKITSFERDDSEDEYQKSFQEYSLHGQGD